MADTDSDGRDTLWPSRTLRDLAGREVWDELVRCSYRRLHGSGETVLQQGAPGTHVLVVLRGLTKVVRTERDGVRKILAFRGPGEVLGEMAVLDGGGRLASVETVLACELGVVDKDAFGRFVEAHDLYPVLTRHALTRVRESAQAQEGECMVRLATLLLRVLDLSPTATSGPQQPVELALTREELAEYLRASRNTVSKHLRELESLGVRHSRRSVVVADRAALGRFVGRFG
ncbi:Crp/Fnr family transcriptional regulator [Streptomyces sp. NPDC005438]|uniref:Crp/Fnr family transcriptional regulator n=1 Tax=Streptomyces sp. NPDC005438 TaxID=3156880 RepID=UPI0033AEFC44